MRKSSILQHETFGSFLEREVINGAQIKRGLKKDLAEFINIHPTSLSQVLNRTRFLTDEQVFLLGEFLNLSEIEAQYVLLLHQIESSSNKNYKAQLIKRKNNIKIQSLNLSNRIEKDKILSSEEQSVFYSSWYYTCIWVFISIEGGKAREEIFERLQIEKKKINEVLEFLIKTDLAYQKDGIFFHKINRTHLEKSSPFLKQHHANWRIKAIEKKDRSNENDLSFTAPLSLSEKDYDFLREEMVQLIKKVSDTVKDTTPDEIYCFNLDLFKI